MEHSGFLTPLPGSQAAYTPGPLTWAWARGSSAQPWVSNLLLLVTRFLIRRNKEKHSIDEEGKGTKEAPESRNSCTALCVLRQTGRRCAEMQVPAAGRASCLQQILLVLCFV